MIKAENKDGLSDHFQCELARLTSDEPWGIKHAALVVGQYLDCCLDPPPEPIVVWATFPNCFEEVTEFAAIGFDENGALLMVKNDVAMRVMPRQEFVRRNELGGFAWVKEQMKLVDAVGAYIVVVVEARKDNGGRKNRVCVYGFTNKEFAEA